MFNHTSKLSNDVGVLRHQKAGRLRQSQNIDRARASLKIRHQHLLKLLRVRVLQLEQETDYRVPRRNVSHVRNNRNRGFARILTSPDHVDDVASSGNERNSIQRHAYLDDFDCLLARHVFGNENVDLALYKIIHHQFLTGELLVQMQHICYIAVWKLKPYGCWRIGRSWRVCRWWISYFRRRRLSRLRRYLDRPHSLGTLWCALSKNQRGVGKHEDRRGRNA